MRWLRRIGIALLVVAVVALAWEPTRVGLQTAVMLPSMLGSGPAPLNLFSAAPRREAVPYRAAPEAGGDPELAELWLPDWASAARPAGAMLMVLGVNNVGRNHPVVARVAEALARTGVVVLVPDSAVLLEGRLEVGEIDGVVRAFQLLVARPEVDPERVGMIGFSVGGSLALLAAADDRIAERVRWVNAFGAFADAGTYLAAVSAHAYPGADSSEVPWTPSPLAREVYLRFLLDRVPAVEDRRALEAALGESVLAAERPAPDPELRGSLQDESARLIHDLLTARSYGDAIETIDALPPSAARFIAAISPVRDLGIAADVHVMHEVEDHHVPIVESERLAIALESIGRLEAYTEFRLFDHVQPDDLDLLAAAPELVKLLLHVRTLMEETL